MDMGYDTIHNIASKNQLHTIVQPSLVPVTQKKTSYNFAYAYNPSGATSVQPHAPNHIGLRTYSYDLDGNQTGWTHDQNGTRRTITWDEESRIQAVFDNGQEKDYKYDDQGQRMIKRGPQGETVYVNQFFTQRPGANGTKHVYAGTTRIASKLLRQDVPNSNPQGNTPFEKDIFFYHPDHIGSTNYVTDLNGKLFEHLEYFPFGEAWVEENSNQQRTPYLFSAKELDEETGLYYFGARYYDPRTSVWQSADPILGKYLPTGNRERDLNLAGLGGVYNPLNLDVYGYAQQNPMRYTDPDGKMAQFAVAAPFVLNPVGATIVVVGAGVIGVVIIATNPKVQEASRRAAAQAGAAMNQASEKLKNWIFSESNEGKKNEAGAKDEPKPAGESGEKPSLVTPDRAKHILEGDETSGGHRAGTGKPGKSEFPANWSDEKILGEISDVATDPKSQRSPGRGGREVVRGTREGVDIEVITEPNKGGRIVTGYPTNTPPNPE
jgi:RHS repeat-associated protein